MHGNSCIGGNKNFKYDLPGNNNMKIGDVFDNSSVLFKDQEVFSENYIPERILGRDEQILEIASYLKYISRGKEHPNLILYGKVGTGKSVVIRYIMREIDEYLKEKKSNVKYKHVYILCRDFRTESKILERIIEGVTGEPTKLVGWSITEHYQKLREALEEFQGVVTVTLDEANLMSKPNELLYNLTRLDVPSTSVSLICITNSMKFVEDLETRVMSSLSPIQIVFPPYNAEELEAILRDRVRVGVVDGAVENEVIGYCAAVSAQSDGDARKAIALLKTAIIIAENKGSDKVKLEHAKAAVEVFEKDVIFKAVSTLPEQHKMVLLAIAACSEFEKNLVTGQVYDTYTRLCMLAGLDPFTLRRVRDLLNELAELDLIQTMMKSKGRGKGRTRQILLGGPASYYIEAIINSTYRLNELSPDTILKIARRSLLDYGRSLGL